MRAYFDKTKKDLFPKIKDWTKEDPLKLKKKKFKDISTKEWFFFDPLPYKLVFYGSPIIFFTNLVWGSIYLWTKDKTPLLVMLIVFGLLSLYKIIRNYQLRHYYKDMSFYKLYMKEEEWL
jgi:hypothetical protein